jgi:hypothetical protein
MLNLLNKKSNLIVDNKIINFTQNRDDKIGYQEKINRENFKKKILFNIIPLQIKNDLIVSMLLINHILNH